MQSAHYRFIILEQMIVLAIINFILNGAIALGVNHGVKIIPLWGLISISGDTFATAFILTLLVGIIVTPITRKKIQSGHLPHSNWRRSSNAILGILPQKTFARSFVLALIYTIIVAPTTVFVLWALNITQMHFWPFIIFKASFAAFMSVLVGPIVAICAIGDNED